ncbi:ATP-binding cassette domain-containing protein [Actinomadura sp. SCN-SB]|uniref:ATP-binding cassette domain-containing protein n=1 Tax=Actinomadura sp. SCN-SB TaxID=3373092 RepID=UPI0037515A40
MGTPLLEIDGLRVEHRGERGTPVLAVDGVSLSLSRGETLGLVGESGAGKSTIGDAILGLVRPAAGRILFRNEDITHAGPRRRRELARRLQVVFQDPYGSLNPSRTIGQTLAEPLRAGRVTRRETAGRVAGILRRVGMPPEIAARRPGRLSGGQRQRVAIARALIVEPELVVFDEPTSALDLSVQAQILNLLLDLQEDLGLGYLFISHDIDVVRHMSHRVAVLKAGRIVEQGPVDAVIERPAHPYTRKLLASVPAPDPRAHPERGEATTAEPGSPYVTPHH